jgi:hypothetical protein
MKKKLDAIESWGETWVQGLVTALKPMYVKEKAELKKKHTALVAQEMKIAVNAAELKK